MTNKKLVAGLLTGISAGVAIALILNTKKGRQTGKQLFKKGTRISDELKGKFGEFIDEVQGKVQGILK